MKEAFDGGNQVDRSAVEDDIIDAESILATLFDQDFTEVASGIKKLNDTWMPTSLDSILGGIYNSYYKALNSLASALGDNIPKQELALIGAANSSNNIEGTPPIDTSIVTTNRTWENTIAIDTNPNGTAGFSDPASVLEAIKSLDYNIDSLGNRLNQLINVYQRIWSENALVRAEANAAAEAVRAASREFNNNFKTGQDNVTMAATQSMERFTDDVDKIKLYVEKFTEASSGISLDVVSASESATEAINEFVSGMY